MDMRHLHRRVLHDLRPFIAPPQPDRVASRRAMARTHLRLEWAWANADVDDIAEKEAMILGHPMRYFVPHHLHYLFHEIFMTPQYAFEHPGNAPRILDAGANIGMAMLWFRMRFPKARITSIEPDAATFGLLSTNIERNRFREVDAIRAALAATPGEVTFYVNPDAPANGRQSVDPLRMSGRADTVPAITLSSLVDGPIDLLKIDIEGSEHGVMAEMESSGALTQVRAITMEYHHHIDTTVDRLSEMLALLERNGFAYRVGGRIGSAPLDAVSVTRFQDIAIRAIRKPTG